MKVIEPFFEILTPLDRESICKQVELIARTCYKSEDKITDESAPRMVKALVKRQHTAMLEHVHITVKFFCDRGVSHEVVRHRLASYAQESTRYCNYAGDKFDGQITYIDLMGGMQNHPSMKNLDAQTVYDIYQEWLNACMDAERHYNKMIQLGAPPEIARSVLNHSTKTELVITMNLREWGHFFNLRVLGTTGAPHPQMKECALPVLAEFSKALPEVFGQQYEQILFADGK